MRPLLSFAVLSLFAVSAFAAANPATMTYEALTEQADTATRSIAEGHDRLKAIKKEETQKQHDLAEARRMTQSQSEKVKGGFEAAGDVFKGKSITEAAAAKGAAFEKAKKDKIAGLEKDLARLVEERKKLEAKLPEYEAEKEAVKPYLAKAQAERDVFRPLSKDIAAYVGDYKSVEAALSKSGISALDLREVKPKYSALPARLTPLQDRAGKLTIAGYRDAAAAALKPGLDLSKLDSAMAKANQQAGHSALRGPARNTH